MHYGGGLGLAYAALGLISFLAIAGVIQTTGGISLNAFRITQMVDMRFHDGVNHALELKAGGRALQYVSKGLAVFTAILVGILLMGYYCLEKGNAEQALFDKTFIAWFVIGGAFPYLITSYFLDQIEQNTEELVILSRLQIKPARWKTSTRPMRRPM